MNYNVTLTGTRPLIMHNARLADPLDPYTKALREITSKRKKTDDDLLEMSRREFLGGLYYSDEHGPCIPADNLMKCMVEGARLHKLGKEIGRAALLDEEEYRLDFDGPRELDAMFDVFAFRKGVRVGQQTVQRTRPRFPTGWQVKFGLTVDPSRLGTDDLKLILDASGDFAGLGEWRPRYGRFQWSMS